MKEEEKTLKRGLCTCKKSATFGDMSHSSSVRTTSHNKYEKNESLSLIEFMMILEDL